METFFLLMLTKIILARINCKKFLINIALKVEKTKKI